MFDATVGGKCDGIRWISIQCVFGCSGSGGGSRQVRPIELRE